MSVTRGSRGSRGSRAFPNGYLAVWRAAATGDVQILMQPGSRKVETKPNPNPPNEFSQKVGRGST